MTFSCADYDADAAGRSGQSLVENEGLSAIALSTSRKKKQIVDVH